MKLDPGFYGRTRRPLVLAVSTMILVSGCSSSGRKDAAATLPGGGSSAGSSAQVPTQGKGSAPAKQGSTGITGGTGGGSSSRSQGATRAIEPGEYLYSVRQATNVDPPGTRPRAQKQTLTVAPPSSAGTQETLLSPLEGPDMTEVVGLGWADQRLVSRYKGTIGSEGDRSECRYDKAIPLFDAAWVPGGSHEFAASCKYTFSPPRDPTPQQESTISERTEVGAMSWASVGSKKFKVWRLKRIRTTHFADSTFKMTVTTTTDELFAPDLGVAISGHVSHSTVIHEAKGSDPDNPPRPINKDRDFTLVSIPD